MPKKQIGGSHYKSFVIEPWTFIQENQLNPFQANVIRYTCRYKNKGGIQDLEKIIHYCEMEIDFMKKKDKQKRQKLVSQDEVEELAAEIAQMQDA
tara:strand:+ start:595 stop:879 length:285 start_codon:yes stop_codon:yes gene_type:complete